MAKKKKNSPKKFIGTKYDEYIRDLTSLGNPIILVIIAFSFFGLEMSFFVLLIGLAFNELIGSAIKYFFHRTRPNGQKYTNFLEKIDAGSFPSIHSSRTMYVYLTLLLASPLLLGKILFAGIIVIVGYSRIYLKKHFLSDVIGGYVLGVILYLILNIKF